MNIDEMTGDELNDLMATEVMGWHRDGASWHDAEGAWMAYADDIFREPAWSPYDDIHDAWKVHKHIHDHWSFNQRCDYYDSLTRTIHHDLCAMVAWPDLLGFLEPIHFCRTALKVVSGAIPRSRCSILEERQRGQTPLKAVSPSVVKEQP